MNLTKELFDFLNSDYKTFHIREDDKYYDIAKIQHNSFIDLLFINSNNYHKTTIGDKFEYCGFYDNEKKQLYDINTRDLTTSGVTFDLGLKYDYSDFYCSLSNGASKTNHYGQNYSKVRDFFSYNDRCGQEA